MKNLTVFLLALFLLLCTGCSSAAPEATEPTEMILEPDDVFLDFPEQDGEIRLEADTYTLTEADLMTEVHDLTIHGNGARLLLEGRPLVLNSCTNLTLENITFCNAGQPAEAALALQGCSGITLSGCQFTGAVHAALSVTDSRDITVSRCSFEDLDGLAGIPAGLNDSSLILLDGAEDSTLRDCTFTGNQAAYLINCAQSRNILLSGNEFSGNRASEAAFRFQSAFPVLEANIFEQNEPWCWYYPGSDYAVDPMGADILPEKLSLEAPVPEPGPQKTVHVRTMAEFMAAIGPDTKIILDCELLDLSTDDASRDGGYYYWEETYDGPQLVISEADNLTIEGTGLISAVPRYANVLSFRFCDNLTLSGFTAGHTVEPGDCQGGVLALRDCRKASIEGCRLYGCGILGIDVRGGEAVSVIGCEIYECSQGGLYATDLDGLTIEATAFRDLGGPEVTVSRCKNASRDGEPILE